MSSQGEVELSYELLVAAPQVAFSRLNADVHELALLGLLEPLFDVEWLLVGFLKREVIPFSFFEKLTAWLASWIYPPLMSLGE